MTISLETAAESRVNNFRIIRLVAASLVIITHAVVVNQGLAASREPLTSWAWMSGVTWRIFGDVAVDIFFAASGFLVAHSLLSRHNVLDYVMARVLRITPGLTVMVLVCALVLGPLITTLPLGEYLQQKRLFTFILFDSLAASPFHLQQELPGVFEANPYPQVINASLWTLPWEIWMYVSLLGLFLVRLTGRLFPVILAGVLGVYTGVSFGLLHLPEWLAEVSRLAAFFYCGVGLYRYRRLCRVSGLAAIAATAVFVIGTLVIRNPALLAPYIAYMTVFLAYWPPLVIKRWAEGDDISYGVYIYAYPVQQLLVFLIGPHNVALNCLMTLAIVIIPAFLSWKLVEKPALGLRARLRQMIARIETSRSQPAKRGS